MTSPSDLLKKANTSEYVMHTQTGGQLFKNPAYYMQPPTANASVWSGDQKKAQWSSMAQEHLTQPVPSEQSAPNQYAQSAPIQYAQSAPSPHAQNASGQYMQNAPNQYVQNAQNQYAQNAPSQYIQNATSGDLYRSPSESSMTIRPPEIPRQYIPQKASIYTELMKKHDRIGPRHVK